MSGLFFKIGAQFIGKSLRVFTKLALIFGTFNPNGYKNIRISFSITPDKKLVIFDNIVTLRIVYVQNRITQVCFFIVC